MCAPVSIVIPASHDFNMHTILVLAAMKTKLSSSVTMNQYVRWDAVSFNISGLGASRISRAGECQCCGLFHRQGLSAQETSPR
jgi:hypothetical protein